MKRRSDLIIAFLVALAMHGIAGVCAGNLLTVRHSGLAPVFKEGESSLVFTILPSNETVPEPAKEPEVKQLMVLKIQEKKEEIPEKNPAKNNADMLEKGVETFSVGITELRPYYPFGSRLRGEEGVVTVNVEVNFRGQAENVKITKSSGYPALDREAVNAVRKARFVTHDSGAMAGGEVVLSFRFKLID